MVTALFYSLQGLPDAVVPTRLRSRRPPRVASCEQAEFVPGLSPWSGYCHGAEIPGVRDKLRSGEIRAGIMPMVYAVFHASVAGKSCELSHVARGGLGGPAWA